MPTPAGPDMMASVGDENSVLWRALPVARTVLLGYTLCVNAIHADDFRRPGLAWAVLTVLALWTVAAPLAYNARSRRPLMIGVELALALGALALTPYAQGDDVAAGVPSVPSFWLAAPVLAAAVRWEWRGGLVAGVVAAGADIAVDVSSETRAGNATAANVFLLLVAGLLVGYAATLLRDNAQARAEAVALAAATEERERLARAVHDGVLQTLAWVARRGNEIGGEARDLARVAGEQEVALRGLVHSGPAPLRAGETADLAALLGRCGAAKVSVATPGEAVLLPVLVAEELAAAVAAALDNTARHAPGAKAYVFLEDEGGAVVIEVGDDGPGIPDGRLDEAKGAGRMGVAHSIQSRLAAIGGTATLRTAPGGGVEWQLKVRR
ncbi:MAG: MacS family sensor histidine kinase [Sporichthyaceae bacterium]